MVLSSRLKVIARVHPVHAMNAEQRHIQRVCNLLKKLAQVFLTSKNLMQVHASAQFCSHACTFSVQN